MRHCPTRFLMKVKLSRRQGRHPLRKHQIFSTTFTYLLYGSRQHSGPSLRSWRRRTSAELRSLHCRLQSCSDVCLVSIWSATGATRTTATSCHSLSLTATSCCSVDPRRWCSCCVSPHRSNCICHRSSAFSAILGCCFTGRSSLSCRNMCSHEHRRTDFLPRSVKPSCSNGTCRSLSWLLRRRGRCRRL